MQDGIDSTPEGAEDTGSSKPGHNSEQASNESSESGQPEKVYDFVHQHFGVAIKKGSEALASDQSGRVTGSRTEVADKHDTKSDSWHALKSLIRYQSSTTTTPAQGSAQEGGSFEAQWFGKSQDTSTVEHSADQSAGEEAVRLKWTPIVDNVPDPAGLATLDEADEALPNHPDEATLEQSDEATLDQSDEATLDQSDEATLNQSGEASEYSASSDLFDDINSLLDEEMDSTPAKTNAAATLDSSVEETADEDLGDKAAAARSKFGTVNAFEKFKQRTQEIIVPSQEELQARVETKEQQSITGDIPEEVQNEDWSVKKTESDSEGAKVMNQWCSTSTGDSIPSLAELDAIPTPTVLKESPPEKKPFSLSTPRPEGDENAAPPPHLVHREARASWLKAASDYSASVIKAVTEQVKTLGAKPKKVTPESPEIHTAEIPEPPEENSQL